jgi:hypothetical protein
MAQANQPPLGGGTNSRPLQDTVAETGPGLPDDAGSPERRDFAFDEPDFAQTEAGRRLEAKLRAEVLAAGRAEDEATADPTGHA